MWLSRGLGGCGDANNLLVPIEHQRQTKEAIASEPVSLPSLQKHGLVVLTRFPLRPKQPNQREVLPQRESLNAVPGPGCPAPPETKQLERQSVSLVEPGEVAGLSSEALITFMVLPPSMREDQPARFYVVSGHSNWRGYRPRHPQHPIHGNPIIAFACENWWREQCAILITSSHLSYS